MMSSFPRDEIVEHRTWRSGVEIVSRINWSQIARVRQSLGLSGEFVLHIPGRLAPAYPTVTPATSPVGRRAA